MDITNNRAAAIADLKNLYALATQVQGEITQLGAQKNTTAQVQQLQAVQQWATLNLQKGLKELGIATVTQL